MGKMSRRNRNKKTGNDAASATAIASAIASATDSATAIAANGAGAGTNQCFHGSTADKFHPNGEYMKAAQEYLDMRFQAVLLDRRNGSQVQQEMSMQMGSKYDEDHMYLIKDPEFHRFIFAFCTKLYLGSNNFEDQSRRQVINALLFLGLKYRHIANPDDNLPKHLRDIKTERGMIKVLVRETKTHCPCMNEGKVIAKTMDKIGKCHGCQEDFPKMSLLICSGCQFAKYHSRDCQLDHWHIHKSSCEAHAKVRNDSNNRE
ncbi:hypothetical protein FRACYDRAFT_240821 [Fragilariopsis cylindrus CCMP1102]|uniref:MYND-type domain-containing protein n=1 Tax=Fragilariopsis cylindrus CCMP1102 TaxID=635003 RepID=A0A1E7F804_9STRA|nr:hypothetical protein FRACYDRAFT_240821 [Fragilariopsis cylindrus CCMP1102]|eukprot:OEU14287.1 hypothetical protein FRACYDRAFT_240821 [Fragilariopsis cylindrus CCMP1102]